MTLVAQVNPPAVVASGESPSDSLGGTLATITTDTGDMKFGHHDFTRYTTPRMCEAAAFMTLANVRTSLAAIRSYDTLRSQPLRDTTPRAVQQLARICSAKFTLVNTAPREWAALFELSLLAGNDSLAQAVLTHRVASVSTPDSQTVLRLQALHLYLGGTNWRGTIFAAPARLDLAQALVTTIDQTTDTARGRSILPRMEAHSAVLQFAFRTRNDSLLRHEAAQIAAIAHLGMAATGNYLQQMILHKAAYQALMQMAYLREPDSMLAIAARAQADLRRFPPSADICPQHGDNDVWQPDCRTVPVNAIVAELNQWRYIQQDRTGKAPPPFPPVHADFWFPEAPLGANPDVPAPGKVTLLVHFHEECLTDPDIITYAPYPDECNNVQDRVRNLATRYGPKGLVVVVIAWDHPSVLLSGLETPAEAANRTRWLFQDHDQLPVTVGVVSKRSYENKLPWQGGMLFLNPSWGGMVVLDAHGERLYDLEFDYAPALIPDFSTVEQVIQIALQNP